MGATNMSLLRSKKWLRSASKLLWLGFGMVKHFIDQKREKAMIEAIESLNHRLIQLEEKTKENP